MSPEERPAAPGSQLRGRYLVQNPALWNALAVTDRALRFARPSWPRDGSEPPPRKLLLANGGHLGDVVIASAVLPLVRAAWPDVEIGFLVGSWSRVVIEGHPLVSRIHTVDHWKLNRSATTFLARLRRYRETRSVALKSIRAAGYDLAVDLYAYFPNSIPLLWQAGIPRRVGYETGGFGPLLTQAVEWRASERHMAEYHLDVLEAAGVRWPTSTPLRYAIHGSGEAPRPPLDGGSGYVLIHMGAGSPLKEWPAARWREVVQRLAADGHRLVFTGSGAQQARDAEVVAEGIPGCRNLCDLLSWPEFVETVRGSRLVVSVDSVAGHIAAAVDTPSVVIATGLTNPHQWRPLQQASVTLRHHTPCAPCYRSLGCASMECIRGLGADEVLRAIRNQLGSGAAGDTGSLVDSWAQRC